MGREDAQNLPFALGDLAADLLQDLPCGIAVSDPDGRLHFCNQTLRTWLGAKLDLDAHPKLSDYLTVPGRIFLQTHVMPMLRLQGFAREIACQLLRAGSEPMPVLLNAVLRHDRNGKPLRIDYTVFDATERSRYEADLRTARREAEELAAIVRSSPNAILRVDNAGVVRAWNKGAETALGHVRKDALNQPVDDLVSLADHPSWFSEYRSFDEVVFEARHENGRTFEITMAPIGDTEARGSAPDFSVVLRDVTERKKAEQRLRLMVREMDHRVKNTLSVVNAIARQTLPGTEHQAFGKRLMALTRAHDALTEAHWDIVELTLLLGTIQDEAGGPQRFTFDGPAVTLRPRQMTALSMIFHEMITNALKYGALTADTGRVHVRYVLADAETRTVVLDWTETGGPPARAPKATGFGTRMIRVQVQSEFDGAMETEFRETGLFARFTMVLGDPGESEGASP